MNEPDQRPEEDKKPHVAKSLIHRRRLLRMTTMTATARQVRAEQRIDEAIETAAAVEDSFLEGCPAEDEGVPFEDACDEIPRKAVWPEFAPIAEWVNEKGCRRRDPDEPIKFENDILRQIHELRAIADFDSALKWIRDQDVNDSHEKWEQCLNLIGLTADDDNCAWRLAYVMSAYIEVIEGTDESWLMASFDDAYNTCSQNIDRTFAKRRYAQNLYNSSWSRPS